MVCILCKKEIKEGELTTLWQWKFAHVACVQKKKGEDSTTS